MRQSYKVGELVVNKHYGRGLGIITGRRFGALRRRFFYDVHWYNDSRRNYSCDYFALEPARKR